MIAALRDRNYEDITLSDLLAAADVGRSTFYSHFPGKDGLLRQSFEALRGELLAAVPIEPNGPFAFATPLLEHAAQHRDVYRHLRGRARVIAMRELDRLVADLIRAGCRGHKAGCADEADVQFLKGGFLAVLTWWLEHPDPRPEAHILSRLQDLAAFVA